MAGSVLTEDILLFCSLNESQDRIQYSKKSVAGRTFSAK